MAKPALPVLVSLILLSAASTAGSLTIDDFDRNVDFTVTLREMSRAIREDKVGTLDLEKFYIVNGTIAEVIPFRRVSSGRDRFFAVTPEDLFDPVAFLDEITAGRSAIGLFLQRQVSEQTRALLLDRVPGTAAAADLVAAVLADVNGLLADGTLLQSGLHQGLSLSSELRELLATEPAGQEETGYLSRLILDQAFFRTMEPVRILVEIVSGEWIGTETVESHHAIIVFGGAESFRLFSRRQPGSLAIPANSRIMAVVRLIQPVELSRTRVAWMMDGYRIRRNN